MAENSDNAGSQDGPLAKLRTFASSNPSTEKLFNEAESYVAAKAENLVSSAGKKLGETTKKLTDSAQGGGGGMLLEGGKKIAEGKSPGRAAIEAGGKGIKDKVKDVFSGLTGGGKGKQGSSGGKFNNIVEDVDVGVPVRVAFDQWVQYQEYSRFTRGVLSVSRIDDVGTNWTAKVAKSKRSWKATVTEQIPDQRIAWTTEGAKGTIKGVVTFHPLGENLTKILLVIEYYPSGFFEKTANMWWAASRRVRLDLKHYRRFIMMQGEATGEGWRGEIRDGEVVRTHEEAMEQEEQEAQGDGEDEDYDEEAAYDEEGEDEEGEDEEGGEDEDYDVEAAYDEEDEDEEGDEDEDYGEEAAYDEEDEDDEAYDEEDEDDEASGHAEDEDEDEEDGEEEPAEQVARTRPRRPSRARPRRPSRHRASA